MPGFSGLSNQRRDRRGRLESAFDSPLVLVLGLSAIVERLLGPRSALACQYGRGAATFQCPRRCPRRRAKQPTVSARRESISMLASRFGTRWLRPRGAAIGLRAGRTPLRYGTAGSGF